MLTLVDCLRCCGRGDPLTASPDEEGCVMHSRRGQAAGRAPAPAAAACRACAIKICVSYSHQCSGEPHLPRTPGDAALPAWMVESVPVWGTTCCCVPQQYREAEGQGIEGKGVKTKVQQPNRNPALVSAAGTQQLEHNTS